MLLGQQSRTRPYVVGSGEKAGVDLSKILVPPYLPDHPEVRKDIADYYGAVQTFDKELGAVLMALKKTGEEENTVIVVCSDNGWQMPRGLANLYDFGTRVPLIIAWPGKFKPDTVVDNLVTLNDLAPTFLALARVPAPTAMTGQSLLPIIEKEAPSNWKRDFVVLGRERHAYVRQQGLGYPGRAIRSHEYLYVRNYEPDRWPAGDPPLYGDIDPYMLHYPGPTKFYMLANKNEKKVKPLFQLGFGKRPAEELFDIRKDPYQLKNVATDPAYQSVKEKLARQMQEYLTNTSDPRTIGGNTRVWDTARYFNNIDRKAHPGQEAQKALKLDSVYNYDK